MAFFFTYEKSRKVAFISLRPASVHNPLRPPLPPPVCAMPSTGSQRQSAGEVARRTGLSITLEEVEKSENSAQKGSRRYLEYGPAIRDPHVITAILETRPSASSPSCSYEGFAERNKAGRWDITVRFVTRERVENIFF